MRTITASSQRFTSMTTFGSRIAASCDDGTLGIYDSITGVLRLSLSPKDPVQAMRGAPDGSVLFCAHKAPSITAWDMQTGGLIHAFVLERNPKDIAVSSKGRYMACGFSDGSVEVWEVANQIGGAAIWSNSPVNRFCWLEQEERLAVSTRALVAIWDMIAGTVLQSFTMACPVHHMAYSQKLDQLAVMANLPNGSAVTIINLQTGTSTLQHQIQQKLSCFAFSQATEELVCGMEAHGLQLFDLSKQSWKHIEYPDALTSVSSLQNGTVVANFADSGLQLLNLGEGYAAAPSITEELSLVKGVQRKCYDVDNTCEWVISDSKKICWIPPGYIGSVQSSYHWASGNSLVMAGKDGRSRILTFRRPF